MKTNLIYVCLCESLSVNKLYLKHYCKLNTLLTHHLKYLCILMYSNYYKAHVNGLNTVKNNGCLLVTMKITNDIYMYIYAV